MLPVLSNQTFMLEVNQLMKMFNELSQNKMLISNFILRVQKMYAVRCEKHLGQLDIFEQNFTLKAVLNSKHCSFLHHYITAEKKLNCTVMEIAKTRSQSMKMINFDCRREEQRLSNKAKQLINDIKLYCQYETQYNSQYQQYQTQCERLKQLLNKMKKYEDPIVFYQLGSSSSLTSRIETVAGQCERSEALLRSHLIMLDDRRKILAASVKEIKEEFFLLLHRHLENFRKVVSCLTEIDIEPKYTSHRIKPQTEKAIIEKVQAGYDDTIYSNFFNSLDNYDHSSPSSRKLLMESCHSFREKACDFTKDVIALQKSVLAQLAAQIHFYKAVEEQYSAIERQVFKTSAQEIGLGKKLQKCFGNNIATIMRLSEKIVRSPRDTFTRMKKVIEENEEKLRKLIIMKDDEFKHFKLRFNLIMTQSNQNLQHYVGKMSTDEQKKNYQTIIASHCFQMKKVVEEFTKKQAEIDETFAQQIQLLMKIQNLESENCHVRTILIQPEYKLKYEIFQNLHTHEQIIFVIKSNNEYNVFYNDALTVSLFQGFRSLIERQAFQEVRIILQKKQYQDSLTMNHDSKIKFCCGAAQSKSRYNNRVLTEHDGQLLRKDDKGQVSGTVAVTNNGVTFQEVSMNPFKGKVHLIIPIPEIKSFSLKNRVHKGFVDIETKMGLITIASTQSSSFFESIAKNLSPRIINNLKEKNDTSSGFLRNSTASEFRFSYSYMARQQKMNSVAKQSSIEQNIEQFIKKWRGEKYLSESFHPIVVQSLSSQGAENDTDRQDYIFQDEMKKFLLKEKRSWVYLKNVNLLTLKYEWKVSYPEMPMLKSFCHHQEIIIDSASEILKITILQKKKTKRNQFMQRTFFKEIEEMNRILSQFVSEFFGRDSEVCIQNEQAGEGSTISQLDDYTEGSEMISDVAVPA